MPQSGLVPVPDPTTLTNELVSKAVESAVQRLEARLDGADKLTNERIKALIETVNVFKISINERFQLGDVQTEKAARDVKSAVDAAFAAAKEAVGEQNKSNALSIAKSEVATTKQIDQLTENLRLSVKTTDDKIGDLKDRILAMEARHGQSKDSGAFNLALAAVLVAVVSAVSQLSPLL